MKLHRKQVFGLFFISVLSINIMTPTMAFDLGKIIEKSIEKNIDRRVRNVENKVTTQIDKTVDQTISSVIPNLNSNAKKDDGQQKDLSKGIIIFGFDGCPHCRKAYAFMNKHKIRYQLMDTQKDQKAARIAKQNGIRGVPVLYVSGEKVTGFSDASYTKLFKKHGVIKK